jgi:cytochrome P450
MGKEIVVTSNPRHAKEILMNQGSYPYRTDMKSSSTIFEQQKWPAGIPWATGDDWKRRRAVLGETLLMQQQAKHYVPHVIPAANRMVDCLTGHLNSEGRLTESVRLLSDMFALSRYPCRPMPFNFNKPSKPCLQKRLLLKTYLSTLLSEPLVTSV